MLGGDGRLRLPRAVYEAMIEHAHKALPMEAVGLLGGSDGLAFTRIPLPNVLGAKHFLADPYAQFKALRQLSAQGMKPLAVYHSHPGGGLQLSAEDVVFASRLPYLQLVIALDRSDKPVVETAAYALAGSNPVEVPLDIELT